MDRFIPVGWTAVRKSQRAALLTLPLTALVLAGCMSRPPATAGLSCPVSLPHCSGASLAVGGYNDSAPHASGLITGSIAPVEQGSADDTLPVEQGSADDTAAGPVDLTAVPPGVAADAAGVPSTTEPALALAPALRLRPATEAASADPMALIAAPPAVEAMASAQELGLRSTDTPLTLDPPVQEASFNAAQSAADGLPGGEAASEDAPIELASAGPVSADDPLPPARQFTGDISVSADPGQGPRMSLADVVSRAATMHPEVTLALAQVEEARATADRARSGLGPQVDVALATGQTATGTYDPRGFDLNDREANAEYRVDATIRLRQMLFDFNVTRDEILSTVAASDAARLRTIDVTEDIALRTSQAYLRIFQQRQLLALIERNIVEHQRLLEIVELNEADGNSTMADVNRVAARLSEVRSARTDLAADLDAAEDTFERLARIAPGRLDPPASVIANLAPSADDAIDRALSGNPSLLSLAFSVRAAQHELDVVNGDGAARIDLELEANSKSYVGGGTRTENDVRGMVVFSYNLFDSGDSAGEQSQAEARIRQARARYTNNRDQVEADIRQAYRAIASARRKLDDLRSGLQSSRQVQALYTEQFQAGERTIFELLDAQNALFSAERDLIVSQFSELEAAYSVLRSTGRLTSTILNQAS